MNKTAKQILKDIKDINKCGSLPFWFVDEYMVGRAEELKALSKYRIGPENELMQYSVVFSLKRDKEKQHNLILNLYKATEIVPKKDKRFTHEWVLYKERLFECFGYDEMFNFCISKGIRFRMGDINTHRLKESETKRVISLQKAKKGKPNEIMNTLNISPN